MKIRVLDMLFVIMCCFTVTSHAMTSNIFSKMTSSSGDQVCSNDTNSPYHVFPMFAAGGETWCGIECLVSSLCWYYQFKSSPPEQCELYNKWPVNFIETSECIGFKRLFKGCFDGFIEHGQGCYKLAVGQLSSWNQADEYCSALNTPQQAHLVNIENFAKQRLMASLVFELSVIPPTTSINLALHQPTWQSSTLYIYQSGAAVDGNKNNTNLNFCACTDNDPSPWLAVDLGRPTDVYGAAVTNRDSWEYREDNFIVGLTNNLPSAMPPTTNGYVTCGQGPNVAPASATMFVKCADNLPPARYVVIIQQYQQRGYLQICELEVYQKGVFTRHSVNLALNRPTWQSSNYFDAQTLPRFPWYAVDGTNNTIIVWCAMTANGDTSPWWSVDLGVMTYVYGAALTNRNSYEYRDDNFTVGLTNNPPSTMPPTTYGYTRCGQWPGSALRGATMFVKCADNLPPARYVVIIQQYQPRGNLQICELEVYGKAFVWLNGRRLSPTSPFQWSPYSSSPMPLTYTNWAVGMPDTAVNSSCLAMDVSSGKWYAMLCNNPKGPEFYAMCETP